MGFGPDWIWAGHDYQLGAFSQFGGVFITGNQAAFQATAVNQVINVPVGFMPVPPLSGLAGRNQFAQVKFISSNGLVGTRGINGGPSIFNGWDATSDYKQYCLAITVDNVTSALILQRFDTGVLTTLQNFGNGSVAPNDIVRLEGRINVGSVDLTVIRNGVTLATVNDNSANRAVNGSPGLHRVNYASNASPGTSEIKFDDYSCGTV